MTKKQNNNKNEMLVSVDNTLAEIMVSNNIIMGIGKQTLLGKKIFLLACKKVTNRKKSDYKNIPRYEEYMKMGYDMTSGMVAEIDMADVKPAMGKGKISGSKYEQLNKLFIANPTSSEMEHTLQGMFNMFIKSSENGFYARTSLIQTTLYDKKYGKLFIKFTEEPIVRENVIGFKKNYTKYPDKIISRLYNFYAFSLYLILKSDFDKQNGIRKANGLPQAKIMKLRYELAELRFKLGILPTNITQVGQSLEVKNPNYTDIEDTYFDISSIAMPRYNDLKKYVLTPAQKEIGEETNMQIEFEPVKKGKRIVGVDITVMIEGEYPADIVELDELEEDDKLDIEQEILELIEEKITLKDIKAIAEAAGYNVQKVKEAYEIMKTSSTNIENIVGFLIKAIQNEYKKNPLHKKNVNDFNNFEKRDYDFDEIEEMVLNRK